ncbi:MAG: SDR family NAD(P)-dependent oxidoreductase, partial [Blastopirellula sp. JB062]
MDSRPVAIITGASQGLGEATAQEYARRGHDCVLIARNESRLQKLATELEAYGAASIVCAGDLSNLDFARSAVELSLHEFGRIDVLVNNAAWRELGSMRTLEPEQWDKTLRICLTAPAFLAKWCAAAMEKSQR